jgi:aminoglycoside phosphotransferase (APT) family kinase protein
VDREILLNDRVVTDDPEFFQGSAVVGGEYVVKFAWAEAPARRMVHDAKVLGALGAIRPRPPAPALVATSEDLATLVTRLVPGAPLINPDLLGTAPRHRLGEDLARFMAALHVPAVLRHALVQGVQALLPECQADTTS